MPRCRVRVAVALIVCAVALCSADSEGVTTLEGEEAQLPVGWIRDPADALGEGAGAVPVTALTTSASFSGTNEAADYLYKVIAGGKPMEAVKELQGEVLMGESMDDNENLSRVPISGLQGHLEQHADMMGKISRLTAVKVLLSMGGVQNEEQDSEDLSLIQVSAGASTGWGRRRRGSEWKNNPIDKAKKQEEKAEEAKANGSPPPPGPKPPPKVVVKKQPGDEHMMETKNGPVNEMDEARNKAEKSIEMAREKGDKATKKAEEEAEAAQREADDKKAFELAEKRKHEVTNKEEKQREKKMKEETERSQKRAKEAATKAEQLQKAVEKAKEASDKEQVVEKKAKKAKEKKLKEERKVEIEKAKEKASKHTKESAEKKIAELKAKFGEEATEKSQKEKQLKHKHEQAIKKVQEKSKKKTEELARKTAEETKNKDEEEKALKARDEKKMKAATESRKKAEAERQDKADKENGEKKKREEALKVAAKRRIEEEQQAKAEKRKAMEASAEMATKQSKEQQAKADAETKAKAEEEVELKKSREKKEKDAREVTAKKSEEIVRKTTREHTDKMEQEKSTKAYTEQQHKEKKKKAFEKVQKILEGLKNYEEKLAKAREKFTKENAKYRKVQPIETKHKSESKNLQKIAKELAQKIKGQDEDKKQDVCDLGNNLESLKKKGLLTANEGECAVECSLKPSDLGIQAQCKLDGKQKDPACLKLLYTRMQSLSSALISEFDAFKKCTLSKSSELKGPTGAHAANMDTPEAHSPESFLLGEGEDGGIERAVPKDAKDGVEVGDYIYTLKDLQDVRGTVSVGQAMDLLMKCNRESSGHGEHTKPKQSEEEDELGMSYSPSETENFNVAAKQAEAKDGNPPADCSTQTVENTIENIMSSSATGCQFHCQTSGIDYQSFTSECTGSGQVDCFLTGTEAYYRAVSGSFLSWKTQCVSYHNDRRAELTLVSS